MNPNDFDIQNGVLTKYRGKGGDVTILDGVTSIGDCAFYGCSGLTSVTIPDSVKTINLLFGEKLPDGLIHQISSWYPRMTDGTLKQYVLNKKTWNALDPDTQMKILVQKLSKALAKVLLPLIKQEQAERTAEYYLEKATSPLSAAECKKIAAFITYFHNAIPDQTVSALYKALLAQKNGKKSAEELVKDLLLKDKLMSSDGMNETLSEIEKKIVALAKEKQTSVAALEIRMKDFYSLTAADIPTVTDTEGKAVPQTVMFFLLTTHETYDSYGDVIAQYKKPEVSPEAAEIVAFLDKESLQNALRKLASQNLGMTGHSKKMYLAYPICRYADEALMEDLTKKAPKWRSSVSGNEEPPLRTFRDACVYSETRAALLFAEKYEDLDEFASVRGMTADLLRDRVLSDIGLAPDGTKTYALGNQTVKVVLQSDLSFIIQLENGKCGFHRHEKEREEDREIPQRRSV